MLRQKRGIREQPNFAAGIVLCQREGKPFVRAAL